VHLLHVALPQITNGEVRQRYRALVGLVEQLAPSRVPAEFEQRANGDVTRFIGHARHTIKNALLGLPLPEGGPPPLLDRAGANSLWTPVDIDPEDLYFQPAQD
jgi:hypothetical protein